MNKEEKAAVVDELSRELSESEAIFAIDYRGISVPQAAELRADLRDADTRFRVVKNRLTLLAADKAGTGELKDHLEGPTALALVRGDAAAAAKTIFRLGREWEVLAYKGGLMDGDVLDPDSFQEIARLPGRDQLDAQFAGIVASPLTGLVRGLGSMVQGLALQLQAIADQGLVTGEAPAEEAPAEQAPAEQGEADEETSEEAEGPAAETDPEPSESPEEAPSEERAPEGEEAGEQAKATETGEGDAEIGSASEDAQDESPDSPDTSAGEAEDVAGEEEETSEDSNEDKEEDG